MPHHNFAQLAMIGVKGSYLRNFLTLFSGNSIGQLIPFALAPVISRMFSPEQFAVQENFIAMVSLLSIASAGRYELALLLPKLQKTANELFVLSILLITLVSLFSLSAAFFSTDIAAWYGDVTLGVYVKYVGLGVFFSGINSLMSQWIIRLGNFSSISVSRIIQSFVQNFGYIALGYMGMGVKGLIWAWLLGNILPVIYMILFSIKSYSFSDVTWDGIKGTAATYRDFPLVNSAHAFTDLFATQFLLYWIISKEYGALYLGLFAIMSRYVKAPLGLISGAVSQLYFKEASELKNSNGDVLKAYSRSVKIIIYFVAPAMLAILLFGPELFKWYLGEKWIEAGAYARIMIPAVMFNFISSVVSSTPLVYDRQKRSYLYSVIGYIAGLLSLYISAYFGFDFKLSLCIYSGALSVYYIAIIFWYKKIIVVNQ